jgi:hypothetical protein
MAAMRAIACLLLLLAAPAVQAQMYKCTEGGKTRYSDKPIADCKSAEVKGKPNTYAGTPTPARRKTVTKEQAEFDNRCTQLRREQGGLRRGPETAAREERLQQLRKDLAACN